MIQGVYNQLQSIKQQTSNFLQKNTQKACEGTPLCQLAQETFNFDPSRSNLFSFRLSSEKKGPDPDPKTPSFDENPLQRIARSIFFPNTSKINPIPQNPSFGTSSLGIIFSIAAMQYLIVHEFYSEEKHKRLQQYSTQVTLGAILGSSASWALHQNPYLGAAIGIVTALPLGLALDPIQQILCKFVDIEQTVQNLRYGARVFFDLTVGSIVGKAVYEILPSFSSENQNLNTFIQSGISIFSAFTLLCILEEKFPLESNDHKSREEHKKKTKGDYLLTPIKFLAEGWVISQAVFYLEPFATKTLSSWGMET